MIIGFNFLLFNVVYYNNNLKLHRLDGLCVKAKSGSKFWYKNHLLHREDGPAEEYFSGLERYYLNNKHYFKEDYWKIIRFKGYL